MSMQRLLLVDDEKSLLRLMEKFLKRAGYEVDSCECAEDAWRLFSAEDKTYAVVIVDLGLPDMSGDKLLIQMRQHRPGIRAVICSGMPPSGAATVQSDDLRYLQKPFLPRMLIEVVIALTGGPPALA